MVNKEPACQCRRHGSIAGLGRSLEEGMATHSSILAWRIPLDRERSLAGYKTYGRKESDITEVT